MVLTAQRSLFGRTRVPPVGSILCGHHIPTERSKAGVLSPGPPSPFSPHGNVELILEANPAGTHYHGHARRIESSPSKRDKKPEPNNYAMSNLPQKQSKSATAGNETSTSSNSRKKTYLLLLAKSTKKSC